MNEKRVSISGPKFMLKINTSRNESLMLSLLPTFCHFSFRPARCKIAYFQCFNYI